MTVYRHTPSGLARNTRYRVDTASGSVSAAAIQSPNDDTVIAGSIVTSNLLGKTVFEGPAATLYLKELGIADVASGVVVTSTGVVVVDAAAATSAAPVSQANLDAALAGLSGSYGPGSTQWLQAVGGSFGFVFVSASATDVATGLPTTAVIKWPDATTGAFTGTIDAGSNGYSGFVATWVGSTTKTLTATGITYDANGTPFGPTGLAVS